MIFKSVFGKTLFGLVIFFFLWRGYIWLTAAEKGDPAPDFNAVLYDGTPFKLSELKGQYVLLDFWASWCGPCRRENQNLVRFYQNNKDKVVIVSVALERDKRNWKRARESDGLVWKHHIVEEETIMMGSSIARAYGVNSIPSKFLIDPNGVIVSEGTLNEMEEIINK